MDLSSLYQELIIDHGTSPRNFSTLNNPTVQEEGFNPLCGDRVIVFLEIKDDLIINATFQGHGCAISTASASIMTENVAGKTKIETIKIITNFINQITTTDKVDNSQIDPKLLALMGVKNYPSRVKCATLAWHTLQTALKNNV